MAVTREHLVRDAKIWKVQIEDCPGKIREYPALVRGVVTGGGDRQVIVTWADWPNLPDRTSYRRMAQDVFASPQEAWEDAVTRLRGIADAAQARAEAARHAYHLSRIAPPEGVVARPEWKA